MLKPIALFLFICSLTSCFSDVPTPDELKEISFMPTSCSEPWDEPKYTDLGVNRGSRIIAYLKANGVKDVYNFESKNDGKVYCQACTCPSGEVFTFKVSVEDYDRIIKIAPFNKLF